MSEINIRTKSRSASQNGNSFSHGKSARLGVLGGLVPGLQEMGVNLHYMDVIWDKERRDERSNI